MNWGMSHSPNSPKHTLKAKPKFKVCTCNMAEEQMPRPTEECGITDSIAHKIPRLVIVDKAEIPAGHAFREELP